MENSEIKALVNLVDDEDDQSYGLIRSQIINMGVEVMPFITQAQDESTNDLYTDKLKSIYKEISLKNTIKELEDWQQNNYLNLFQGCTIIAQFQYPNIEMSSISNILNKIRQDYWLEVNDNHTPIEKVKILNNVFFNIHGFIGNTSDYYAPENSFINDVLLNKKGNPIALSVIYSVIAQSLDIPIYGVNTPRNFMLVYLDNTYSFPVDELTDKNILFYINPFARGEIHSLKDIFNYLKRINKDIKTEYYLPCSNATIIRRSVNNIIVSFDKMNNKEAVSDYRKILDVLG